MDPELLFTTNEILRQKTDSAFGNNTRLMKMKGENLNDLSNKYKKLKMIEIHRFSGETRTLFSSKVFRIPKITKVIRGSGANYF